MKEGKMVKRSGQKRVLHVLDSLAMGGAETWLMGIVKFRNEMDLDFPIFDFLITGGEKAYFDDDAVREGCGVYYIKLAEHSVFSFIRQFRDLLSEKKYVAIHDHQDFLSGWHFLFGSALLPGKRVVHIHNPAYQLYHNYGVTFSRRMKLKLGKYLVGKLATNIVGTSGKILEAYGFDRQSVVSLNIAPLYCSFDLERFRGDHLEYKKKLCAELGWSVGEDIILFVGRFDYSLDVNHPQNHKNSVLAVRIFMEYLKKGNARMIMVGKNDFIIDRFTSFIDELGISDRISILGVRDDVQDLMKGCDLLLFPSREEGMGLVAVEAQATGLPVLASEGVPREVSVIHELVEFLPLDAPLNVWAETVGSLIEKRKPGDTVDYPQWKVSDFNIINGIRNMKELYNVDAD